MCGGTDSACQKVGRSRATGGRQKADVGEARVKTTTLRLAGEKCLKLE